MLMNTAEQILVIILAAALAVFLVLAIIIASQLIRLMKTLQNVAGKAEAFVDSAEKAVEVVKSTVGQISIIRFVQNMVNLVQKRTKKNDEKGE